MTEQAPPDEANIDDVDATGQPIGLEQVDAPQQVPMSDDAGGPSIDRNTDGADDVDATTEELSVQGGDA